MHSLVQQQVLVNEWYSRIHRQYDSWMRTQHEIQRARRALVKTLQPKGQRILEVGIGTGKNISLYQGAQVTGLDINLSMLRLAKKRAERLGMEAVFICGDARALPLHTGNFDICVLTYALSGIPGALRVLKEVKRAVRPGGLVGILDFAVTSYVPAEGMVKIDLDSLVRRSGMQTVAHTRLGMKNGYHQAIYVLSASSAKRHDPLAATTNIYSS